MIIAGIVGNNGTFQTSNLINSILSSKGKKVSIIEYKALAELDSAHVKSYMNELGKSGIDVLLLKIGGPDAAGNFFKELHLDSLIYIDKSKEIEEGASDFAQKILALLGDKGFVIANVDDFDLIRRIEGSKLSLVTYGFNSQASITTSSVGDMMSENGLMCCLQKPITARSGPLAAPHEYRISFNGGEFDSYNILAAATFAIINGIEP